MKAFITGVTGFVGPHLAALLLSKGAEVTGLGVREGNMSLRSRMPDSVTLVEADVRDAGAMRQVLAEIKPDHVYHLAAISNVPASFENPRLTYDVNVGGTLNLLDTLRELQLRPRIVNVSTAHVYASAESGASGLDEDAPLRLSTPYAASKFMSEALAAHYVEAFGFQLMTVRPFNHIGPGQSPDFACSEFARQIAHIQRGKMSPVLRTGNLAPERDFTDVRDVVEAYWTVALRGVPGQIYNISSQAPHSMSEIVALLGELAGVTVAVEPDPAKVRAIDTLRLCGNSSKLRALGWEPRIPLKQSLQDILEYWAGEIAVATGC